MNESQFENSVFFDIWQVWHDGVVGLDQVRVLKTEFDLWDQNQSIGSNKQADEGVSFEVLLIDCFHPCFPEFVESSAELERGVLFLVGDRLLRPLSQEVMHQNQQLQSN